MKEWMDGWGGRIVGWRGNEEISDVYWERREMGWMGAKSEGGDQQWDGRSVEGRHSIHNNATLLC